MSKGKFAAGMIAGAVLGAVVGALVDPVSDKKHRRMMREGSKMFQTIGKAVDGVISK